MKNSHGGANRDVQPVDRYVGSRMRMRRNSQRLTQNDLAEALGITFQQVQKYENGGNRISAGRLWQLAVAPDVPITWFFDGLSGKETARPMKKLDEEATQLVAFFSDRRSAELVRGFVKLNLRSKTPWSGLSPPPPPHDSRKPAGAISFLAGVRGLGSCKSPPVTHCAGGNV